MVSSLLIVTTVCLSAVFYVMERRVIRHQADAERHAILENLVHITQESLLNDDDLLMVKYTGWLQKWNPALVSASVVGAQGRVLAHSEPDRIGTAAESEAPPEEELVMTEPVRLGAHWMATASVGFSAPHYERFMKARVDELQRKVLKIVVPAVAVGLAISFGMALSWTRPIEALAAAAQRIGHGDADIDLTALKARKDELGRLARSFQRMTDDLRQLDQMKEDFVSAVTHELRSPLGAIESYLNLIAVEMNDGLPASVWETYLERLRANTGRLTRFVNDLLDVAALERGKVSLEPSMIDVGRLAQEVLAFFEPRLKEKMIHCEIVRPSELPPAFADAEKIRQVLINLMANAIKFTPDGGRIEIRLAVSVQPRCFRIAVKDSGIGISAEDQRKLFNKFEQVRSARRGVQGPKGTGLGLSISQALVRLHGGTLCVQSRPQEGSEFYFSLPIESVAASEVVA